MNYSNPTELMPPEIPVSELNTFDEPEVKWWCSDPDLTQMYKANDGDAGFDICASEDVFLDSYDKVGIHTGLHVAIPYGYVGLVRPRSGLSFKTGYSIGAGVIDAGYRGEVIVQVRMCQLGLSVKKGDRIAQLVVVPCLGKAEKVESLEDLGSTERGDSGFGSSGE